MATGDNTEFDCVTVGRGLAYGLRSDTGIRHQSIDEIDAVGCAEAGSEIVSGHSVIQTRCVGADVVTGGDIVEASAVVGAVGDIVKRRIEKADARAAR